MISLSQPHDQLVLEILKASKEWGFFAIKDHDVPSWLIHRVQEVGQGFFAQPPEEKEKYANDLSKGKYEGYGTKLAKGPDEKIEWIDYFFHIMSPPSRVNYEIWPQNPPNYRYVNLISKMFMIKLSLFCIETQVYHDVVLKLSREVTDEYNRELLRITDEILALLSEGLGLGKNVFKKHLGDGQLELEMKINMYPPCPQPELVLGVEPHTDMSALTILLPNDVPGLQVWKDGNWISVDYIPGALYIHIGDQVEVKFIFINFLHSCKRW